jgi:hypothetical protein
MMPVIYVARIGPLGSSRLTTFSDAPEVPEQHTRELADDVLEMCFLVTSNKPMVRLLLK